LSCKIAVLDEMPGKMRLCLPEKLTAARKGGKLNKKQVLAQQAFPAVACGKSGRPSDRLKEHGFMKKTWSLFWLVPLGLPAALTMPALAAQAGEEPADVPLLFSVGLGLLAIGLGALVGRWIRDRAAQSLQKPPRSKIPRNGGDRAKRLDIPCAGNPPALLYMNRKYGKMKSENNCPL
jgi:hypothetical protein